MKSESHNGVESTMQTRRIQFGIWCLLFVVGISPLCAEEPHGRHALLVGVTQYPNLPVQPLIGPGNDVKLLREVLLAHGFQDADIVTLAEEQPEEKRPTYEHIHREFEKLAKTVRPKDQVVILLSGHGTQQPDQQPPDPNDPEPDGLDEVFLASDATRYDRKLKTTPNGIVDDDLSVWVRNIRDQGALIWIMVDSCHSGTVLRGASVEVERRVPPEVIVPEDLLAEAKSHAVQTRGGTTAPDEQGLSGDLRNIVAIYAAQPEQCTIEQQLPSDSDAPQWYGLLTYSICRELNLLRSPISYRELGAKVQSEYVRLGRTTPTPFVEGGDVGRQVLGEETWPDRSRILLSRRGDAWQIDAGSIHGLTVGTVLEVLPLAGTTASETSLGHVVVKSLRAATCTVEPVAYGEHPKVATLPDAGRCELAFLDLHLQALKVAVDVDDAALQKEVTQAITEIQADERVVELADLKAANWVIRRAAEKVVLEPATGIDAIHPNNTPRFGPAPTPIGPWIKDTSRRIAKAQNLMALAKPELHVSKSGELIVKATLLKLENPTDTKGTEVPWEKAGLEFHAGELLAVRLENEGSLAADVTLFFIDSGYGIATLFPRSGTVGNRLYSGRSIMTTPARVTNKTVGLEHVVMIAVPGTGEMIDFSLLEQPTLPRTRSANGPRELRNSFGEILKTALFGVGTTRGENAADLSQQCMALISWQVVEEK